MDDTYALYLEAIDKYIMDSIYKKVKNETADEFEKEALSQYYMITHLKENNYTEYKYKKQIFNWTRLSKCINRKRKISREI